MSPEEITAKWLDSKAYVRVDNEGKPQLVRVEPIRADDGVTFIPQSVYVYLDNEGPMIMDRGSAEALVQSTGCAPLELNAHYKHVKVN